MAIQETELLKQVKIGLKELSNYNDSEISLWIKTAKGILRDAGISEKTVNSERVIGLITIAVNDLRLRKNVLENGNFLLIINQIRMRDGE